MSPDIMRSKLLQLFEVLEDLKPHVTENRELQEHSHYEIERQVQLSVDISVALGRRMFFLKGLPVPDTSREVFIALGQRRLISKALAKQMASTVGLRNLLVHEYGKIDYSMFFGGLRSGFKAFVRFSKTVNKFLDQ